VTRARILTTTLRLLVVVGVVGVATVSGSPARAAGSVTLTSCTPPPTPTPPTMPSPQPTSAPQNCVPAEGSVIAVTRTLAFTVDADSSDSIDSVAAYLDDEREPARGPGALPLHCSPPDESAAVAGCQSPKAAPASGAYTFTWDPKTSTPYNGSYTFRVNADFSGSTPPVSAQRMHLIVDTPPRQPKAPRIVAATTTSVTVAWDASPEPDRSSYALYRAITKNVATRPSGSQFKLAVRTTRTSARDPAAGGSAYWYRVQATRASVVTPKSGVSSVVSDSSAPVAVATSKTTSTGVSGTFDIQASTPPGVIPAIGAAAEAMPADGPFSANLPYEKQVAAADTGPQGLEAGSTAAGQRGAVLPVAVGALLVACAMLLGKSPSRRSVR